MQSADAATIFKLICRGLDREQIVSYANETGWNISPAELDELIEQANAEIARKAAAVDLDVEFGKAIVRLDHLYVSATKVQDLKTALAVQKETNKLLTLQARAQAARGSTAGSTTPAPGKLRLTIAK